MGLPAPGPELTAVVTGASSGIGAEIARELARRGHGVTLVARRRERLEQLAGELTDTHRIRAEVLSADLTDEDARAGIATSLAHLGLSVGIVVNNAGLSTTGPVHRADPAAELRMVRTDVEAVVHLCTLFLGGMVERGAGGVLNVASTAAFQPLPGQAGYGASKAFVLSYGYALRGELKGTGVHCTTLCPGPVETEFGEVAGTGRRFGRVPAVLTAEEAAQEALAQIDRRAVVHVPTAVYRLTSTAVRFMPRAVVRRLSALAHREEK
jgi:short-subunit dehydrogenase